MKEIRMKMLHRILAAVLLTVVYSSTMAQFGRSSGGCCDECIRLVSSAENISDREPLDVAFP